MVDVLTWWACLRTEACAACVARRGELVRTDGEAEVSDVGVRKVERLQS